MKHKKNSYKITVMGTVQGVGFRPFIYGLAKKYNLKGMVGNSSNGVEIFINSSNEVLNDFISDIKRNHPPLSTVDTIKIDRLEFEEFQEFKIIETQRRGDVVANIPPDISICKRCESELFDPNNRRYLYPFITCTNCGVRYSIIYDLPYDRVNTSMKFFKMCKNCEIEYRNPSDRRYHAEPIGCWDCGVELSLHNNVGDILVPSIEKIVELILKGYILTIKGVGGYHLICDATNAKVIKKLRDRKRRPTKPFAVMVKDIEMAKRLAYINDKEEKLLSSKERPIVLLRSKAENQYIAPNISKIGIILPYTPLHLLILAKLNRPIVATSANITDEPIATDRESIERLSSVYDYLLDHNRKIINGCDDSVVMVVKSQTIFIRRARGYTPIPIRLPFRLNKKVLAVGANQKNSIAIGFDNRAILSPHIGDLDGIKSLEYFKKNIENLKRIYHFKPEIIAHDKHPNYESSKYAKSIKNIERKEIQHHHAHILAVMTEKNITEKVLGVAFDGTGYGEDGNLWGGEFLICDYKNYERVAHLNYFKLLGGDKAIKEPRRTALSFLFDIYGDEVLKLKNPTVKAFTTMEIKTQYLIWKKRINSPLTSSVGRLFDAVSSLSGVCQIMSFEGESGMRMEKFYNKDIKSHYSFYIRDKNIDIHPMIEEILREREKEVIISKFFNTLVEIIYNIYKKYNLPLVLSGGVFQNSVLLELILEKIPNAIVPNKIPPNDGGIALGMTLTN